MKRFFNIKSLLIAFVVLAFASFSWAGTPKTFKYGLKIKDGTALGTPPSGYGHLYVNSDILYFKNDGGTATDLLAVGGSTAWDDLAVPDANESLDHTGYYTTWDFGDTDHDMFTLLFTAAFGDVSGMVLEQKTGNATDGTLLELKLADTDVDFVSMAIGGVEKYKVDSSGNVTVAGNLTVSGSHDITTLNITTLGVSGASTLESTVTLDDGSGASPNLSFKDGTDETAIFSKEDSGELQLTTLAADGFQIITGNLRVGNGSPGTASMNGEDAYIEGQLEVDGAIQLDGALTAAGTVTVSGAVSFTNTLALSENVTFTMAADEYFKLDADSTPNTTTAGVLDINYETATNTGKAIYISTELEDGATLAYGIYNDVDDDTTGSEVIHLYSAVNSAGTNATTKGFYAANTIDDCFEAILGVAGQGLIIDGATALNTHTDGGLMDLSFRSATTTAQAINLDVESDLAGGAAETVVGLHIQLDDDANTATDILTGIEIDTDADGTGLQHAIVIKDSAGWDAGLWLEGGYLRVGTGGTPDQTLSDGDNAYLEGFIEVDGNIYADGNITGDGATEMVGVRRDVVDPGAVATYAVTAAMSGTVFINSQATEFDLPADPTGLEFTFIVHNATNLDIDPNGTDRFPSPITNANGDYLRSSTIGDSITIIGISATNWYIKATYPAATDWVEE